MGRSPSAWSYLLTSRWQTNFLSLQNDALSFATVHDRHITRPTINLEDEDDDDSEEEAPAAAPSSATPPRMNPNNEATRNIRSFTAKASTPREEVDGDMLAADGG